MHTNWQRAATPLWANKTSAEELVKKTTLIWEWTTWRETTRFLICSSVRWHQYYSGRPSAARFGSDDQIQTCFNRLFNSVSGPKTHVWLSSFLHAGSWILKVKEQLSLSSWWFQAFASFIQATCCFSQTICDVSFLLWQQKQPYFQLMLHRWPQI